MKSSFPDFVKQKNLELITAVTNYFIFLPYFFSVRQLLKTMFRPWKNIISPRPKVTESINDWFSRLFFNLISSLLGACMRTSIIGIYLTIQVGLVVFLPFIVVSHFLALPARYFLHLLQKPTDIIKNQMKTEFVQKRCLEPGNREIVSAWFEKYYLTYVKKLPWWDLKQLLSTPPLARDWTSGYTPTLDLYGEDITLLKPHYINLIDREKEISEIEQILSKSDEHNCLLVGPEGVGKHTIIEGLAKRIYDGKSSPLLIFKRIIKIDIEQILSKSTDFVNREQLLKNIFIEAANATGVIILIDKFDKYISGGDDRINLTDAIASFAKSPSLQIIGITTPYSYEKYVTRNETIKILFEKVDVYEIRKEDAREILMMSAPNFEKRYGVTIPYETIVSLINKSDFYITNIPFPEKAIDLLDEICVYANHSKKTLLTPDMIDEVLTRKTHAPVKLDQTFKDKLVTLEEELKKNIIAQDEGVNALATTLRKSFVAGINRKKPLATLLFLGPTGVGKTETAKVINNIIFGHDKSLLRFDMSLFQTKYDIPNLIGSQEANIPGLLTSVIREQPYGVLLIDEIEKADKDLLNIFLTILDEGYFTDGFGEKVNCKNLIVVATSNAGADFINQMMQQKKDLDSPTLINYLIEKQIYVPEFLNRFDGIVVYKPLDKSALYIIASRIIADVAARLEAEHQVKVQVSQGFIGTLIDKGYNPAFGARELDRVIRTELEDKLAKLILENKLKKGEIINF